MQQRLNDRGDQVGATADRLGNHDIGALMLAKAGDGIGQFVEMAAKTGPGDFSNLESQLAEGQGIDEVVCLIVGHDSDT